MKKTLIVITMATTIIFSLGGCGNSSKETKPAESSVETRAESETIAVADKDFPEGDYEDTGDGILHLATAAGTSEDGNIPIIFAEKDALLIQIGLNTKDFDSSKLSFIYIDGMLVQKEQLANTQTSIELKEDFLKAGLHLVQVVQYSDDEPGSDIVTYKSASYEIKEK